MAAVTVTLPKDQRPAFPPVCIGCGADRPAEVWRVRTHGIGVWPTFVRPGFGPRFAVDVPACPGCRRRLRRGVRVREAVTWGLALGGAALAVGLVGLNQGFWGQWLAVGVALTALVPLFVWERVFPPALDLTAWPRTLLYDFRDASYAEAFRERNAAPAVYPQRGQM
jgi:hypothetical protein